MRDAAAASRPRVARRLRFGLAALALPLAACGGAPLSTYDLNAAKPAPAHAFSARVRVAEPLAALDLDGDRILVRTGPHEVAALAGAKWPDRLPLIVQARLTQSFQNAGLARQVGRNPAAAADYVLDLDIRKFELDVARLRVEIDVAAKLVSASGGVAAAEIFTADAPAASSDPATVAAAMDGALSSVMKRIVAFVATRL
ncbi:MAG: ABC-type transport auxiliary lipoprotein family protein [Roseiarcus sp.]|jgi:cholesterol transport system auxiliary component